MLIKIKKDKSAQRVINKLTELKCRYWVGLEAKQILIVLMGNDGEKVPSKTFESFPEVEEVIHSPEPYLLSSRDFQKEDTVVKVGKVEIGGNKIVVAAGPCAVESREQIFLCAKAVKDCGGQILRGGAFKPRTSPFTFQGLKEGGLELLVEAGKKEGLLIITEVIASEDVSLVSQYADILQVGARNMQNIRLLEAVGKTKLPVLLKRGPASSIKEWLSAAEYVLVEGNNNLILCERGIVSFSGSSSGLSTRYILDIGAIPIIERFSHLPIIVDPSHAAGHFEYVASLAKASIAAGADGLLIEIHPNPKEALSDGPQQLTISDFKRLMKDIEEISSAVKRK